MIHDPRKRNRARNAISAHVGEFWMILPPSIEPLLEMAHGALSWDAAGLIGRDPGSMPHTALIQNGVATIPVNGPNVPRETIFSRIFGLTSAETIAADFSAALRDPNVRAIVLDIDSPGGAASGIDVLASQIYAGRGKKPIAAYIEGTGASAAY